MEKKNAKTVENNGEKKKWTQKHAELWKFIKFSIAGCSSSAIELLVHILLLNVIFKSMSGELHSKAFEFLHMTDKKVILAYMISTTVGYTIAFIMNRKISFKADSNVALSIFLYIIMVIFTIFANGWIGDNINSLFISIKPSLDASTNTVSSLIQKVICMLIPTLWTYPCNRFIIHRKKKEQ